MQEAADDVRRRGDAALHRPWRPSIPSPRRAPQRCTANPWKNALPEAGPSEEQGSPEKKHRLAQVAPSLPYPCTAASRSAASISSTARRAVRPTAMSVAEAKPVQLP